MSPTGAKARAKVHKSKFFEQSQSGVMSATVLGRCRQDIRRRDSEGRIENPRARVRNRTCSAGASGRIEQECYLFEERTGSFIYRTSSRYSILLPRHSMSASRLVRLPRGGVISEAMSRQAWAVSYHNWTAVVVTVGVVYVG